MNKKAKRLTGSTWGLTLLLALVLFGLILLLLSFLAWYGYRGIKAGQFTASYLLETPTVIISTVVLISVVLSVVVMFIVQRLLILPIGEMTDAIQKLAGGQFNTRLYLDRPFRPRAVQAFSDSFNQTAEQLNSVEILRSDFISNFSHELKTPIHSLVGIAELLKSGDCTPEETAEYLDIIISQSKRLAALSENILHLTKLETQTDLAAAPVNASELLRQALVLFDQRCSDKGLELNAKIEEVRLLGSGGLLTQMMTNLLDNAVKFSPEGGTVAVELSCQEEQAIFRVVDQGCGMDQKTVARIFDKFYQGDTSHAAEGFGLGLPMVKKIVELHHGRLTVESSVGRGTAFIIELPME